MIGQKHTYEGTKAFLKIRKPGSFVIFYQFSCSWIRIPIPNTGPDQGQPNERIREDPDPQHYYLAPNILYFHITDKTASFHSQALIDKQRSAQD